MCEDTSEREERGPVGRRWGMSERGHVGMGGEVDEEGLSWEGGEGRNGASVRRLCAAAGVMRT